MSDKKKNFSLQTARSHDGVLVFDAHNAKVPAVVRLKMNDIALAQFHVRSNDQGSSLGFSTGRDDFNVLATFADRVEADAALASVRTALLRTSCHKHMLSRRTLLWILGGVIGLFTLLVILSALSANHNRLPPLEEPMMLGEPEPQPGMPMDADSKLAPPPTN